MPEHFAIDRRHTTHLTLRGEFDLEARDALREALLQAVAGGSHLIVDLAGVTFLDSESLGALVEGYNATEQAGLSFAVTGARGAVRRVLELTGFLELTETRAG
ncbi:MAG: STAS domain-containing protein [Actinoplanes sp.]